MSQDASESNTIKDRIRRRFRSPFHINSIMDSHVGHVLWRNPLRAKSESKATKRTSNPRINECCAAERERWRQQQRAKGSLCSTSKHPRASSARPSKKTTFVKETSFLDLPPELRSIIYEYYFSTRASSPERLTPFVLPTLNASNTYPPDSYYKPVPPHDPPLCLTSRLIRHETRPIFFRTHRFPITIHLDLPSVHYVPVLWYRHLDPTLLHHIRHLEVHYCFEKLDRTLNNIRAPNAVLFDIDLHEQLGTFTVVRNQKFATLLSGWGLLKSQSLDRHVSNVMTKLVQAKGVRGLDWRDLESFAPGWARIDGRSESSSGGHDR